LIETPARIIRTCAEATDSFNREPAASVRDSLHRSARG
jgi:hypothetical protein